MWEYPLEVEWGLGLFGPLSLIILAFLSSEATFIPLHSFHTILHLNLLFVSSIFLFFF